MTNKQIITYSLLCIGLLFRSQRTLKASSDVQSILHESVPEIFYHYQSQPTFHGNDWSCIYNNLQNILQRCIELGILQGNVPTLQELLQEKDLINVKEGRNWLEPGNVGHWLEKQFPNLFDIEYCWYSDKIGKSATQVNKNKHKLASITDGKITLTKAGIESTYIRISKTQLNKKLQEYLQGDKALPPIIDETEYSYNVLGIHMDKNNTVRYKIGDPHCWKTRPEEIKQWEAKGEGAGMITWKKSTYFEDKLKGNGSSQPVWLLLFVRLKKDATIPLAMGERFKARITKEKDKNVQPMPLPNFAELPKKKKPTEPKSKLPKQQPKHELPKPKFVNPQLPKSELPNTELSKHESKSGEHEDNLKPKHEASKENTDKSYDIGWWFCYIILPISIGLIILYGLFLNKPKEKPIDGYEEAFEEEDWEDIAWEEEWRSDRW